MRPLVLATLAGSLAFAADWPKEPDSFKGVKFGWSVDAAKQKLQADESCSGPYRSKDTCVLCFPSNRNTICTFSFVIVERYTTFYFTFKNDSFVGVTGRFKNDEWNEIKDVFLQRYGDPTGIDHNTVQNGAGATYENEIVRWFGPNVKMSISKYGSDVDWGSVGLFLNSYLKDEEEREAEQKKKSASGL